LDGAAMRGVLRWHPLHGQRVRRIQSERRASGELVHVELTPGAVTIIGVECEMALRPWSTDRWRDTMLQHEAKGRTIKRFDVSRLNIRERDLQPKGRK
jgi:hypothetical protein